MAINNAKRKLYNLLISEFEKQYDRTSKEKVFVVKSEAIAMLKSEYIKNIMHISGCLCAYFDSKVSLTFDKYGVTIVLNGKKEYKYMTRSHLMKRWGPRGRVLIEDFAGEPDKLGTNGKTPTQFYLTSRIEEIEQAPNFKICFLALYHEYFENFTIQEMKNFVNIK